MVTIHFEVDDVKKRIQLCLPCLPLDYVAVGRGFKSRLFEVIRSCANLAVGDNFLPGGRRKPPFGWLFVLVPAELSTLSLMMDLGVKADIYADQSPSETCNDGGFTTLKRIGFSGCGLGENGFNGSGLCGIVFCGISFFGGVVGYFVNRSRWSVVPVVCLVRLFCLFFGVTSIITGSLRLRTWRILQCALRSFPGLVSGFEGS